MQDVFSTLGNYFNPVNNVYNDLAWYNMRELEVMKQRHETTRGLYHPFTLKQIIDEINKRKLIQSL